MSYNSVVSGDWGISWKYPMPRGYPMALSSHVADCYSVPGRCPVFVFGEYPVTEGYLIVMSCPVTNHYLVTGQCLGEILCMGCILCLWHILSLGDIREFCHNLWLREVLCLADILWQWGNRWLWHAFQLEDSQCLRYMPLLKTRPALKMSLPPFWLNYGL